MMSFYQYPKSGGDPVILGIDPFKVKIGVSEANNAVLTH